jgi:exodeoxyribonuclease V beta subunit
MAFKKFLAYSASAGSGKTYALSVRYISLLFLGESPSSILAATFTKKAANEMNERIITFLKNIPTDKNLLQSVALASGLDKEEILKNQTKVLQRFLKEKNYIITLDSFFNTILRLFALELGLEPNFEISDSVHDDLEKHFIKELEHNNLNSELVKLSLILEKRRASDVLTLFEELFNLEAILPETNYTLAEIEALKKEILTKKEQFLYRLQELKATDRVQNIFKESDFKKFITKPFFEKSSLGEHAWFKNLYKQDPSIDRDFFELKELIKKYLINKEETLLYYLFILYNHYKNVRLSECKGEGKLSFDDILYYTYRLVSATVSKDFIYFKLDSKFKHILLDEFQDTSSLQYLILEPLIEEIFSGSGSSDFRSFFYVGDTKQSLYRFRGGVEGLFNYLAQKFNITIEHLDTNYRSAKNIVSFTNETFLNSEITDFTPQKANSTIDGYVEVVQSEELLEKAKEKVEFYLKAGANISDIAILVFANKDGVNVQEYLKEHNINSILKTSSSLKYNPKIAALVQVLEYMLKKEPILLAPFLAKINKESIDLSFIEHLIYPFEILDRLISTFAYFDNDENILKLLDFAKNFSTVEEFLDEFSKSNIALAKKSLNGVHIMTIHGSKGLEFKYVIVLDRFSRGSYDKNLLLFEEETPIKIKKIHTKEKAKEHFVQEYAQALEKNKELAKKDKLNLLYVAITRAELALSLIKKSKSSEFDILNLQETQRGSLYIAPSKPEKEYQKLINRVHFYGKQELEHSKEEDENELKEFDKIYFGEALHYALELISFLHPDFKALKEALLHSYGELLEEEEIKEIIARVENLLKHQKFQELLKEAKVFKEQTISFNKNIYQIDLLLDYETSSCVVDYKSSKKFHNKHIQQVKEYQEAIQNIKNKKTKAYLIYLLPNKIELIELS